MQLLSDVLTLDLEWTGLDGATMPIAPQELGGSTPWLISYKVARSKQGITASSSLTFSNTAIAKLTTGSNTPLTDSTNLQLTLQHKSGTALCGVTSAFYLFVYFVADKIECVLRSSANSFDLQDNTAVQAKLNEGLLGMNFSRWAPYSNQCVHTHSLSLCDIAVLGFKVLTLNPKQSFGS